MLSSSETTGELHKSSSESTTTVTQKIIIDADPGIGDALAILAAMADPSLEVLGLTAVAGSVSGVQATRNLHYLIGLADPLKHPRVGQSDISEASADHIPSGMPLQQSLNGRMGLGEVDPRVPDLHNRRESPKLIVDLVREHPQEVRILTFGPLTNLAMAFDLDPELPMLLNGIICLGGVMHTSGDVTPTAEFNFWSDPQAARTVMRSPIGKILVPLDVSNGPGMTFDDIDSLSGLIPSTPVGEFMIGLLQYAVRANRQFLPREEVPIPAASLVAIAAQAATFSAENVALDVETKGELTNGMTIADRRPFGSRQTNAEVVTQLDGPAVIDYFCRGVRRIAVSSEGRP